MEEKIQGWFETPFYHNVYDQYDLTTDEVLLFGLIYVTTGLNKQSFFYTNKTLSKKFHTTTRTIQNRINKLKEEGLVEVDIDNKNGGTYRTIQLTDIGQYAITPRKNLHEGGEASFTGGMKSISPHNKTKQNKTKNINNTTNVVLEEPVLPTEEEVKGNESIQILDGVEKEKKVPPKKEKGKRREDIDMILEWIKQQLGCTDFKEVQKQQRMAGMQLANLAKKISPKEFDVRFRALMNDDFHSRNMGSLWYIYRQVKGYVPKKAVSSNIPEFD